IGVAFMLSFQKFYVFKACEFVGLDNFRSLFFRTPLMGKAFLNTFYYAFLSISLTFLIPIFVAILLMEMKKNMIRIMMILWFIPVASMAGIIIWKWFYHPQYGLFNGILVTLGLPTLRWLNDPQIAMLCLILPGLIMYGPGLIYIATLQGIPNELYEAAELEGTGFWKKVWFITLPRLRSIMAVMLILSVIGSLQVFDQPFVMTGGGPAFATTTVALLLYQLAFKQLKFGRATALGLILFFIIIAIIVIQRKYFKENLDV
ncbi:unnamed protein product, partial [marine sediment metagenome]